MRHVHWHLVFGRLAAGVLSLRHPTSLVSSSVLTPSTLGVVVAAPLRVAVSRTLLLRSFVVELTTCFLGGRRIAVVEMEGGGVQLEWLTLGGRCGSFGLVDDRCL